MEINSIARSSCNKLKFGVIGGSWSHWGLQRRKNRSLADSSRNYCPSYQLLSIATIFVAFSTYNGEFPRTRSIDFDSSRLETFSLELGLVIRDSKLSDSLSSVRFGFSLISSKRLCFPHNQGNNGATLCGLQNFFCHNNFLSRGAGRRNTFWSTLSTTSDSGDGTIWCHCAQQQGRCNDKRIP